MILSIATLIWILYSCIDGFKDGFYWYFMVNSRKKSEFEIHPVFAAQRALVAFLLALNVFLLTDVTIALVSLFSNALLFSFFHNGMYYLTRNKLDNRTYPLKWRDQSTTSTAKLTSFFNYRNRTLCAVLALLIIVLAIIIKNK